VTNIQNASPRRVTFYEVSYPTLPSLTDTLITPGAITLIQNQYSHDVVVLEWPLPNEAALKNLKTGVPIHFKWTKEFVTQNWVGYVSFVSNEISATPKKRLEVHCVGASFPLKSRTPRVFSNKTIPQVAQILAKEHGLKFLGAAHPRIFTQLTISGQPHWEWLQSQAKRIGFALAIEGTTLHFKPIDELIDMYSSTAPILSYFSDEFPTDFSYEDRTLDYFKVHKGEYLEGGELRNIKRVSGVHPITGKPVTSSKKPSNVGHSSKKNVNDVFFEDHRTSQVVHDVTSASTAAEGAAHMARFTTPATVKCQGNPKIKPFAPVYIDGISEDVDGHWVATKVKHFMTITGEYQIEMTVATDGNGPNKPNQTRVTSSSSIGIINEEAAIKNGGMDEGSSENDGYSLEVVVPVTTETNQGFNRTPTRWKNKPKPRIKVR
jgi:phage protein D